MPHLKNIKANELKAEDIGTDVIFSLADFMGDEDRVKKTLATRGIMLTDDQIKTLKGVFSNSKIIDPVGPVAGVYETCGPQSKTKVCF